MSETQMLGSGAGSSSTAKAGTIGRAAWITLAFLTTTYSFSWMDRFLLVILLDPISRELHASNTEMGLLTGFGPALLYSLAGFPIARLADRSNRVGIVTVMLGLWSALATAMGLARTFLTLTALRFGIAVASAGCSPSAYSLMSDLFPATRRGTAIAIYSLGISIGTWAGLTLGGIASDSFGWRAAFILLGLPGLVLALAMRLVLREPDRGGFDTPDDDTHRHYGLREAAAFLLKERDLCAVALGFGFISFATGSFETWIPTYLVRHDGLSLSEVGSVSGLAQGLMAILGALLFGILSDRLARRDLRWYIWIPVLCGLVACPLILLFFYLPTGWTYPCYFLIEFFVSGYSAPLFAAGQLLLPPRLRALGTAGILFALNVIGMGLGPSLTGWLSDMIGGQGPGGGLAYAIMAAQVAMLASLFLLLSAAPRFRAMQGRKAVG